MFWNKKTEAICRPFTSVTKVSCRGRSCLLQKAYTDFSADGSFETARQKIKEHYGVDIASSTTRLDVEKHAKIMHEMVDKKELIVVPKNEANVVIGETDGCMVPIVTTKETSDGQSDQRKNKNHEWNEVRLALA